MQSAVKRKSEYVYSRTGRTGRKNTRNNENRHTGKIRSCSSKLYTHNIQVILVILSAVHFLRMLSGDLVEANLSSLISKGWPESAKSHS